MRPESPWLEEGHAFSFWKGRVALHALLRAAKIGEGDEVLLPAFTCVVVPLAVHYTGATPRYYDAEFDRFGGDPADAAARITPATRAIIVQHSFGIPAHMGDLRQICAQRNILLLEDCAHAMGATLDNQPVGTLGDGAFASLQWSKPVSCGLGGIARANKPELAAALERSWEREYVEPPSGSQRKLDALVALHHHLLRPSLYWPAMGLYRRLAATGLIPGSSSDAELNQPNEPADYRLRFGQQRKSRLEGTLHGLGEVLEHRRVIAAHYRRSLEEMGVHLPSIGAADISTELRLPILVRDRNSTLNEARRDRIELGEWFNHPLHPDGANSDTLGFESGKFPRGEWLAARVLNLPTHRRIDLREAERIMAWLRTRSDALVQRAEVENLAPPQTIPPDSTLS